MTFQDLKIVKKFDKSGAPLGTYNNIFIQDGCERIKDNFVETVRIEDRFYESMLNDFAIYDERVLASYKASNIGGTTVYHVSYGQKKENSLSEFFRIYAVQVNATGAFAQAPGDELYFVANINPDKGTIKLRRSDGEIPNLIVDMETGIFLIGEKRYRAVMEIVGVGSHEGSGGTYRLAARNENLFADSRVTL